MDFIVCNGGFGFRIGILVSNVVMDNGSFIMVLVVFCLILLCYAIVDVK